MIWIWTKFRLIGNKSNISLTWSRIWKMFKKIQVEVNIQLMSFAWSNSISQKPKLQITATRTAIGRNQFLATKFPPKTKMTIKINSINRLALETFRTSSLLRIMKTLKLKVWWWTNKSKLSQMELGVGSKIMLSKFQNHLIRTKTGAETGSVRLPQLQMLRILTKITSTSNLRTTISTWCLQNPTKTWCSTPRVWVSNYLIHKCKTSTKV